MVSIKNIILLAASASAAAVPRDGTSVLNTLYTLNTDLNTLTADVSGGSLDSIAIGADLNTLVNDLETSINTVQASAQVTGAAATEIVNYLVNTAGPVIATAVNALELQKGSFIAALEVPAVLIELRKLRALGNDYFSALEEVLPADESTVANVAENVDAELQRAIADFTLVN